MNVILSHFKLLGEMHDVSTEPQSLSNLKVKIKWCITFHVKMSLIHKTVNVQDFTFKLDNNRGSVEMSCISPDNFYLNLF